jgi:hydroxymethylbilane synthase
MRETDKQRLLVIGSRGSRLALTQTKFIQAEIRRLAPEIETRIEIIKTSADKDTVTSLRASGGAGVFVKELEQSLLRGEIDMAVHSMKDVPVDVADGLRIAAVPEREDARDALIISQNVQTGTLAGKAPALSELPEGARVGTGSFRRQAQLLALRPDLSILDIRGNVDTRISKMENGGYDAVALAVAGLRRLGLQNPMAASENPGLCVTRPRQNAHLPDVNSAFVAGASLDSGVFGGCPISRALSFGEMLPAPGQGALAIEVRADDAFTNEIAGKLNHPPTALSIAAERDFLERLGGGCNVPIAIYARVNQGALEMDALAAAPDGKRVARDKISGDPEKSAELCATLAERILLAGGREILHEFRR